MEKFFLAYRGKRVNIHSSAHFSTGLSLGDALALPSQHGLWNRCHRTIGIDTPVIFQGAAEIRPICIEDDVWIGDDAVIFPGVRAGQSVVLAQAA